MLSLAVFVSGCASTRGTLDVRIPPGSGSDGKTKVVIAKVEDLRTFELKPSKPSTPSLKDGQINNKAITSRAIARKRGGYGNAFGDILLPEGRTVEMLVREAVEKALLEKGYTVVSADDAAKDSATVDVQINKYWSWITPMFVTAQIDFISELVVTGPVVKGGKETVTAKIAKHTQTGAGRAWLNTINLGNEQLVNAISEALKKP